VQFVVLATFFLVLMTATWAIEGFVARRALERWTADRGWHLIAANHRFLPVLTSRSARFRVCMEVDGRQYTGDVVRCLKD
jgi:hypothetical protein